MLLSIIIPTRNRSKIIHEALDSVGKQSFRDFEIIVIDDCSSDDTRKVLSRYKEKYGNLDFVSNGKNLGIGASRNKGIKMAKGEYVVFLDDDDKFMPNRLEIQAEKIFKDKHKIAAYYCGVKQESGGKMIEIIPTQDGNIWNLLMKGWTPPVSAQCFRRDVLQGIGGYDEKIKSGVDHDIWMKLGYAGFKTGVISEALVFPSTECYGRASIDFNKRIAGIKIFLKKWENMIIEKNGKNHYRKFYRRYLAREYMKFSILFSQRHDYPRFLQCLGLMIFFDPLIIFIIFQYFLKRYLGLALPIWQKSK